MPISPPASSSHSQPNGKASEAPGPSTHSPLKTSSKLARMKRDEEEGARKKKDPPKVTLVISPKKESPVSSSSTRPATQALTTPKTEKISPKKAEVMSRSVNYYFGLVEWVIYQIWGFLLFLGAKRLLDITYNSLTHRLEILHKGQL